MTDRYSFCNSGSTLRSVPTYHIERAIRRTSLGDGKKVNPEDDLEAAAEEIKNENLDEFCWSLYFEPNFLIHLFHAGFLPISVDLGAPGDPVYCLLPKLHRERCILVPPGNIHISGKVRKRCKNFQISTDTCFDTVMRRCQEQHGSRSWLYRPLRNALSDLHDQRGIVHSVEVWDKRTGELVAGEIGYHVGSVYTSMTGFFGPSGTGSIQLVALGRLLAEHGITVWDLGMSMDYKLELGAINVPREEWLEIFRKHRNDSFDWSTRINRSGRIDVTDLLGNMNIGYSCGV